ncbi:beta-glucosidase 12-like [Aristolochia californica]|uniref:beta-glucosidase 12-like n=1 Tax=Aristolochia californica TaxID=171875 RepID=UPI0035DE4C7D
MELTASPHLLSVIFFLLVHGVAASAGTNQGQTDATTYETQSSLNRTTFPAGFIFGTASASYQYEGAAFEGGKGPSLWDFYTHRYPERIKDRSNGDVAVDSYHRYKEDVRLMKEMGLDAYRFSISWPRILPHGNLRGGVNQEGIRYYNNLINEVLANGLKPFVTLFHWDTPQSLEEEYGGFLSSKIAPDFRDYADVCFRKFGDRVKHWITENEPWTYSMAGYDKGNAAPGRCSPWFANCTGGDSSTEPYIVAHNLLLAHAAAVKRYKTKYQASQKGSIGITLVSHWFLPSSGSVANSDAAQRAIDFVYGWFIDPLVHGDYPLTMREIVGKRLPKFTRKQSRLVKGSFDFIGLNYYTTYYATDGGTPNSVNLSYSTDSHSILSGKLNGIPIGPQAASRWLFVYPRGIRELLLYTKRRYKNPIIYITENGISEENNETLPLHQALQDPMRIDYYHGHLLNVEEAIRGGARVKGYFAWSLLDNFEWADGYTIRFGINFVDFKNGLKRYRKQSSYWFEKLLKAY